MRVRTGSLVHHRHIRINNTITQKTEKQEANSKLENHQTKKQIGIEKKRYIQVIRLKKTLGKDQKNSSELQAIHLGKTYE